MVIVDFLPWTMSSTLHQPAIVAEEQTDACTPQVRSFTNNAEQSSRTRRKWVYLSLFVLVTAAAVYLRVFEIEARPLHSDEGVNYLFIETTNREGYYPYSHENYHGPLYFYFTTWFVNTFGDNLLELRGTSIISGVLTVLILALLVPLEGWLFPVFAALLVALSPSGIFFSRYAIHESLFVFETFAFAICCFYYCRLRRPIYIYLAALSAGALVATKETFPIAVVSICLGMCAASGPRTLLASISSQIKHLGSAYLVGLIGTLFVFTAAFRWPDGVRQMFLALPQWFGRSHSDTGHFKPALYYISDVIAVTEPQLLALFVAALVLPALSIVVGFVRDEKPGSFFGKHAPLARFLTAWSLCTLFIYSAISYKTAWLIINMTLPMTLLAALTLTALIESSALQVRSAGVILTAAVALAAWNKTLKYNFAHSPLAGSAVALADSIPYGPQNPFSYVHTARGMMDLVQKVEAYWKIKPDARVLVGATGYFPLPYYFRKKTSLCAYFVPPNIDQEATKYDIMILDFYKHNWSSPGWEQQYYRLNDYTESYTYFRKQAAGS
jgi:uncharacterized protein (TIGR03663 family)